MYWTLRIGACCGVFLVLASHICSQGEQCLARGVPIIVRDSLGLPIEGIAAEDFLAKVGGKSVDITSVATDSRPRRAVILVDVSSSMYGTSSEQRKLPMDIAIQVARSIGPRAQL